MLQDLGSLVEQYPTFDTPDAMLLAADDVVAYKTLSLCLETWQPVLSDWQFGRVAAVDAACVQLETLSAHVDENRCVAKANL